MKKRIVFGGLAALLLAGGLAFAQSAVPLVSTLNQTDLVTLIPNGQPSAQTGVAPLGAVGGIDYYNYVSPATGFALTPSSLVNLLVLSPSATIATGGIGMEANPGDGQKFCVFSTQQVTSIALSANTGQSFGGIANPSALSANVNYCWRFIRPQATWLRTQ